MRKTLADPRDRAALLLRLRALAPDSPRRWGRMTCHQAVCHLSDSFKAMMNSVPPTSRSNVITRTLVRWIALYSGLQWPHGVRTVPEVDQEIGGTTPIEFVQDRRELEGLIDRFARCTARTLQPHPIFGPLTTSEWQRWGYLHLDHHLRQFGA